MEEKINRLIEIMNEAKVLLAEISGNTNDLKFSKYDDVRLWELPIPKSVKTKIVVALHNGGIDTVAELLKHSRGELLHWRMVGKTGLTAIGDILWERYQINW